MVRAPIILAAALMLSLSIMPASSRYYGSRLFDVFVVGILNGKESLEPIMHQPTKGGAASCAKFITVFDPSHYVDLNKRRAGKFLPLDYETPFNVKRFPAIKGPRQTFSRLKGFFDGASSVLALIRSSHWQRFPLPKYHRVDFSDCCRAAAGIHDIELPGNGMILREKTDFLPVGYLTGSAITILRTISFGRNCKFRLLLAAFACWSIADHCRYMKNR